MTSPNRSASPDCPRRLHTDCVLLKGDDVPQVLLSRRANRMRERHAVTDHAALSTLPLTAPVQPSIAHAPIMGIAPSVPRP